MSKRTCAVEGCPRHHRGHGFCAKHYMRFRRYGDPLVVKDVGRRRFGDHGTEERYRRKCRCDVCVEAQYKRDQERRYNKPIVQASRSTHPLHEVRKCLKAFGVSEIRIAEAGADNLEDYHWGLWRVYGPFRFHCECQFPAEIVNYLEAQ